MSTISDVLDKVYDERLRQDEKWGSQRHLPDGTGPQWDWMAANAKAECDNAADTGEQSWAKILREEVYEALAEADHGRLHTELIQVAAVAVAWAEALEVRK